MVAVIVKRVDRAQRYNQGMGIDGRLDGLSEEHGVLMFRRRLLARNVQNIETAARQAGTNIRSMRHTAETHEPGPTYEH